VRLCLMSFGLIFYVLQSKSSEAEMDVLKDEYHQRVATLERRSVEASVCSGVIRRSGNEKRCR
jgi:TATA element modulatory factor